MHNNGMMPLGPIYTASFQTTSITTATCDVIGIKAPDNSRVCIHEIVAAQPSTDASDRFGVQLLRGSTASSTSAAITPRNIWGWSGAPTAGSSVTQPSATLVSTTSAVLIYADAAHDNRWQYRPMPMDRLILDAGQRLHVRITAPSTTKLNGTITFSEIGNKASS
jgi:hypothetical protein